MALSVCVVLTAFGPPANAGPAEPWSPPVDGPVVRGYEPPPRPFSRRHLGLDFAAPPGTPVRSAGDGVVVFAGRVARAWSVAVEHAGARRTTYAYLRRVVVAPGTPVRRGAVLGESGGVGPGHGTGVVHFGYRVGGLPADPAPLFAPPAPRISLVPEDRPACRRRLGEPPGPPATLGGNPAAPGRESTRPHSNGVRP
ncbi:MAG TPA: M23 family metallopeptidase [Acidimicrobiia bacterium]|nr:M23 family metallopeptidase [Acidimicrobiia bacterium]